VLKNCRNNILESAAYALRSSVARRFRLFHDNVNVLIVMTAFAKRKLLQAGFREDQIAVVPNPASVKDTATNPSAGQYVAFAGRMSPEKGVDIFLGAAERMPNVPFKVAGDGPLLSEMMARAPANVEFLGRLGPDDLREFYGKSQFVVVPSVWFEQFPIVVLEAMARGLPVIASRIGGLPEIVEEGITGSLFEPGNPEDLVQQVRRLWEDPELCNRMGRAGRQKVIREYTEDAYYDNLMAVYQTAIRPSRNSATVTPLVHISNAVMPSSETDGR
jgi:glycosyltransferase involved in cell wall biosynthesis